MDVEDRSREPVPEEDEERLAQRRRMALQNVETWVDQAIRQAQRRGDFDNLPGAGKPLRSLEEAEGDPDWWVKGLVEREQLDLSGAMPTGLALRRERERLPEVLAALTDEAEVRERLEDFNARVLADRRRPHFGPGSPVVVGRADVEAHVRQWRAGRAAARERGHADRVGTEQGSPAVHGGARGRLRRWWARFTGRS